MAVYNFAKNFSLESLTNIQPAKSKTLAKVSNTSFLNAFRAVAQAKQQAPISTALKVDPNLIKATLSLKKDIKLAVPNLIQGSNECGPTSLAMALQYYGINPGDYHNMFESDTVGHGPLALKRVAENKNCLVRQENNGSLQDLVAMVDKGIPALALGIYGGGENSSLSNYIDNAKRAHWMVVTGYKKDDVGNITHIYFNNPNQSTTQCWTASDFQNKFWNNNIIPGGHRYYMGIAKKGTYQEASLRSILPSDQMSDSFKSTVSIVEGLEKTFYAAEEAANDIAEAAEDAANAVADAAEDVYDEVSSWFS